ncbi:alpha/beta-hydrolase [Corynespora cassiicola Philippines]|uniref:Alpha/beta-hydrolase n=1 Tax=Corynespora cassiicola Philippines TaxID=1448308 RepID=A0A2T2P1H2_CORCC|nr:alpha/beta-hydrolase [Corynespora cassiicola Philippines]
MENQSAHDVALKNGQKFHYYEGGSKTGVPLVFLHGWPGIAETWKHQSSYFCAQSKYRVITPDMRGYGESSAPKSKESYALQVLVPELVEFAEKLGITKAIWIAHDWGCGVANALAAHHPELFIGLVLISVPYRSAELGFENLVSLVNRDLYPEDEYEWGQWEYMKYHERHPEETAKVFDENYPIILKHMYSKADPSTFGKPSVTSDTFRVGGWFGGHPEKVPDIPLEGTLLDESLYNNLLGHSKKNGFAPANAYYLNHAANAEYAKSEKNNGVLEFPVLFIDSTYDATCSPSTSPKLGENQKKFVKNLTFKTIDAGHWVQLEKPTETNKVIDDWLKSTF